MNIKDIIGKRIAVNCKTEEEAKKFIKMAYENDCRWYFNDRDVNTICYACYRESTCYRIEGNGVLYMCHSRYYYNNYYRIIAFDELDSVIESYQLDINRKNNETIAIIKDTNGKYIKHAKATCSPDDEYNYEVGKKIALSRLFDIESVGSDTNNKNKEPKVKPFKPYLTYKDDSNCSLGIIGELTTLTAYGNQNLYIGDVVERFSPQGISYGLATVYKDDIDGYFVMGVASNCIKNGISKDGCLLIKRKSYRNLKPNVTIGCVKAVFPEQPA